MKSNSECEAIPAPIAAGRAFLFLFACVILFPFASVPVEAGATVSLTEMARIEAADATSYDNTLYLFRGYMSLGLLPEAASLLERRVRMGTFPAAAAEAPFDALVEAHARFDTPEALVAVCETAIRSGARTPRILYHYGVGLRRAPGRPGDASAILAQVGPGNPYSLLALYALGQTAAERGDPSAAENLFRKVEQEAGESGNGSLARRAARSRAEVVLAAGRGAEAAPMFQALMQKESEPLDRIGLAAGGNDPVAALERLPAEMIAGLPLMERVRFLLLHGGLARESGRHALAMERLTRAEKELKDAISSPSPRSLEPPDRIGIVESLRFQVDRLRSLREGGASAESLPEEDVRVNAVELLTGVLFADWTVAQAAAETRTGGARFLAPDEVEKVVRRIEEVVLDGVEVDRMVGQLSSILDTLQNLGHPIQRYRSIVRLEKSQEEIQLLRKRIREHRSTAMAGVESVRARDGSLLMRELGLYIKELGSIRSAAADLREFTRKHFDIFRKKAELPGETGDPFRQAIRDAHADADRFMEKLLPAMKAFEVGEQTATWERRKPQWVALRAVISRQIGDALLAEARRRRRDPGEEARKKSFAALREAVSLLSGGRLTPGDAADVAVQAGSLLGEGMGRWEPFPGRSAGEREREMIARILPMLPVDSPSRPRREESLYLQAALRLAVKDPRAGSAALEFQEKYPASPLAAEIAVRLGHEALLAGNTSSAVARYRQAGAGGRPEASAVGRYMLAWIRFQSGDADEAARELSPPLSDPSYPCADPAPFERTILSLSVRAWKEIPSERLEAYPPVKAGTCGGKALLAALWEAEDKQGEAVRAAAICDIAARRFPVEEGMAALERRTVEGLLRAGREGGALDRALTLRGKYGPGSVWARSQSAPLQERTAVEMAGVLKILSERNFDEGIRSGERSAMSSSAAAMGEYFGWKGGRGAGEDETLRLKWGIALLRSGDRESGVRILRELAAKQPGDATGERAALLYAEAMVTGYERKEEAPGDAEGAALLLLKEHPSEKAVSIALRASSAFLGNREYERARRAAGGIEGNRSATGAQVTQARLIQAEAAVFGGDPEAARGKAAAVLAGPPSGGDPGAARRAKDIYVLSSLKGVDGKVSAGDPKGAAAVLEELSHRFPDAPEAPMYMLRAMRLYAQGGDQEMATRSGFRFLQEFPRREEAAEVAAVVGPLLEERKEFGRAGDLYDTVASRFPKNEVSRRFLFHAARLADSHGPPNAAERRFSAYAARYPAPVWMWTYATLSVGLAAGQRGDSKTSIRLLEEGLRKLDGGAGEEYPRELADLAGRARIAIGENWAEQFRKTPLVVPLEKSLAIKDRFFRLALGTFAKAEGGTTLELSLQASQLSGDLFLEYGKAILASRRPKGLTGSDRDGYEEVLKARARSYFERSMDWYAGALERLEKEGGTPELAAPIRKRLGTAQALLQNDTAAKEGKAE